MRVGIAVVALVSGGCGFHGPGLEDDGGIQPGEMRETATDDTGVDFMAGTLDEAAVDSLVGVVEPAAYVRGGLHAVAYTTKLFDATVTTWDALKPLLATGAIAGAAYAQVPDDWQDKHPQDLSLTSANNDSFTIAYDGAIHLTAGTHTFNVVADDTAIVEVDLGGGFKTVAMPVVAPSDGWYAIRAAVAEGGGMAKLVIQLDGTKLDGTILRTAVNTERGLVVSTYVPSSSSPPTATGVAVPGVDSEFGTVAPPYDAPMIVPDAYFLRFAGQLRIDQEGDYAFSPTAPGSVWDAADVWIDRHNLVRSNASPKTASVHLAAGWHGLLVDFSSGQNVGSHDASVALAVNGQPIGAGALRPVATSNQYIKLASALNIPLVDATVGGVPGMTTLALPVAPASTTSVPPATIDAMDIDWFLGGMGTATDYTSMLALGTAPAFPMPAITSVFAVSMLLGDEHLRGQPMPATQAWNIQVTDSVHGPMGKTPTGAAYATVTLHGGPAMPFAPRWTYTSAQHPTPGALRIGKIMVDGALDGALARLQIRTTADDNAWIDATSGETPAIDASDFVQYRITITGDGWQYPTIDRVAIDYVVPSS